MCYTLHNCDCLDVMRGMEDESVSCIITDPPYKMNHSTGGCTNIGMKNKWQGNIKAGNTVMDFDLSIKFADWLPEVYRVLKQSGHCYIFCNDKNMQELLNESIRAGFRESNILVWVKNNACPNRYYMKNCEFVLFLYKGKAKPINDMGTKAALMIDNIRGNDKLHPTEKPVELLTIFVNNSTNKGDVVLDPFMGSGSTGVAAIQEGREFVGIEIAAQYYDIASERLSKICVDKGD